MPISADGTVPTHNIITTPTRHTNSCTLIPANDIPALLGQFESFLNISPSRPTPLQLRPLTTSSFTGTNIPREGCLRFLQFAIQHIDEAVDSGDREKLWRLTVRCLERLHDEDNVDEDVNRLQNEFIVRLTKVGEYPLALKVIYSAFRQVYNIVNNRAKLPRSEYNTDSSAPHEKELRLLLRGISFNAFNAAYARHSVTNYMLLAKLVLADVQLMPASEFLSMFNANLYHAFQHLSDSNNNNNKKAQMLLVMKKCLISYSNGCKSVMKLNFLIKAMLFNDSGSVDDPVVVKHTAAVLQQLMKADSRTTYHYTAVAFAEMLRLRQLPSVRLNKLIKAYANAKAAHQEFENDDINWEKYICDEPQAAPSQANTLDASMEMCIGTMNYDPLLQLISSNTVEWDEKQVLRLIKCNVKAIKAAPAESAAHLLVASTAVILDCDYFESVETERYVLEFLDYATGFVRTISVSHIDVVNEAIKNLAASYKKFDKVVKYRNLSNICFQNGGKLLVENLQESLNQWMNCVNYEYNVLNSEFNVHNFKFFKDKIDRIANLLIEKSRFHESKIFLVKIIHCYTKLNSNVKDFLKLESKFHEDLAISLKLLTKSTIASKSLNLQDMPETSQALVVSAVLDNISRFNIDGKTLIVNDIMDSMKKKIKDRGLFQYLLIKYYNVVGLDSFIHVNYKEFNEKFFPGDSCMANYKELIICYNYLQYTINRTYNQTIVFKCTDLFHRWIQLKPCSVLSNNDILAKLEFAFVELLISYLSHQGLHISSVKLLQDYLLLRQGLLSPQQLFRVQSAEVQALLELQFNKLGHTKLALLKPSNVIDNVEVKMMQFQYNLNVENTDASVVNFSDLTALLAQQEFSIKNESKRYKIVETLILLSKFSYLASKYKYQNADLVASIIDIRRSIRLSKWILSKHFAALSNIEMSQLNGLKWEVSTILAKALKFGMQLMTHCGLTKNGIYYVDELLAFLETQNFPVVKCLCFYDVAKFYLLSKNFIKSNEFMIKSDEIYNSLELEDNLLELKGLATHAFYFQMIGDYKNEKVYHDKIELFYKDMDAGKLNPQFIKLVTQDMTYINSLQWEIEYERLFKFDSSGEHVLNAQAQKRHTKMHLSNVITAKKHLWSAKSLLEADPVLSGLTESVVTLPSALSSAKDGPLVKKALTQLHNTGESILKTLSHDWFKFMSFEIHNLSQKMTEAMYLKFSIASPLPMELLKYHDNVELSRYLPFEYDRGLANVREDHHQLLPDSSIVAAVRADDVILQLKRNLPANWIALVLDACPASGDFIITRFQKDFDEPFTVRLPLNRTSNREFDEVALTFDDVMKELQQIITESNATTKFERVSQIKSRDGKLKWWQERKSLDQRLDQLLTKVESSWLGGFKGIFSQNKINANLKLEFKQKFDIILNQYLPSRFNAKSKFKTKIDLHDKILEILLLNLSVPLASTDLLEDLIYFLLDTLLFHGEENSYDEIDIDHMYIDIEELLTKYHNENILREFHKFSHTVLVVGKDCCNFPWESLPCLRKNSVTRLPSLKMLNDLLMTQDDSLTISKSQGSYIINPNNDLSNTEANFKDKFGSLQRWNGIVGEAPTENQFKTMLTASNLLIYIGHGSGDQYIRSSTIKSIPNCAPSLLVGCSSGLLHENGLLEPYGTVYNHLVAGSPMVLVNLWDVTDKDIDKFTLSLLDKWGLFNDNFGKNIAEAVMLSRDDCNLKFLNGAAPIVYGLPFKLTE